MRHCSAYYYGQQRGEAFTLPTRKVAVMTVRADPIRVFIFVFPGHDDREIVAEGLGVSCVWCLKRCKRERGSEWEHARKIRGETFSGSGAGGETFPNVVNILWQ